MMVAETKFIETMSYEITHLDGTPVVKLDFDPPHYLTLSEMLEWMIELRETNSDLYAEMVEPYILLRKATRKMIQ